MEFVVTLAFLIRLYIIWHIGYRRIWSADDFDPSFITAFKMFFSLDKWTYKQFYPEPLE